MPRTPDGPAPPPVVQRLRLRYAKRDRLRFSSHRDFQRAFERALRRAGVPMAFSAGFSPHPKISYANAVPTGVASEAEYVEIALARECAPEQVQAALDASLPPGLDVLEVVTARPGTALADRLEASVYLIRLPGVPTEQAGRAAATLMAAGSVPVERMTKTGLRRFDARPAVVSMTVSEAPSAAAPSAWMGPQVTAHPAPGATPDRLAHDASEPVATVIQAPCAILRVVVRHTTPAVRPDDVLEAMRQAADLAPPAPPQVTRLAQGPLDAATDDVSDPLVTDRA